MTKTAAVVGALLISCLVGVFAIDLEILENGLPVDGDIELSGRDASSGTLETELDKREDNTECDCTTWTEWLNRDDSKGLGDMETMGAFMRTGKNVCGGRRPLQATCVAKYLETGADYTFDKYTDFNKITNPLKGLKLELQCDPEKGLACLNRDNVGAKIGCRQFDFKIKFRCPKESCEKCSLLWQNSHEPGAKGDDEERHPEKVCDGETPIDAYCTSKVTWSGDGIKPLVFNQWTSRNAPNSLVPGKNCSPRGGLECLNIENHWPCLDYKINFCCFSGPKSWTPWLNRDRPSYSGDWEVTSAFRINNKFLCDGMTPLAAECRVTGSEKTFNQWNYKEATDEILKFACTPEKGLACLNEDQPDRKCKDYSIRFLCPHV